ncbi:MAG: hypothetical protein KDD37_04700 [Bdellovibrionales bacterium]|nr:hypothetical protein [Bdellovibrionales bacterium]
MISKKHKKNITIVGILLLSSIMIHFLQNDPVIEDGNSRSADVDLVTIIPKNHTLIPIEVKNSESLDSIFGNYGYVNLYVEKNHKQQLVGKNIKLIRAPKNPSQFAVLVKDEQTKYIAAYDTEFFVSISGEKNSGTVFVKEQKQQSHIQVGIEND